VTLMPSPAYLAIDAAGDPVVRTEDALHGRRRRQRLDSGDCIDCRRLKRDDHETTVDVSTQLSTKKIRKCVSLSVLNIVFDVIALRDV